jgi:phenylpyruvate tautomerase PptA (4-oxalocrotonate tautomerase family)
MPLYTITTQAGVLDGPAKTRLAESVTAFHSDYAGVPKNWVHVVFQEYSRGDGFSAGLPSATAALTLLIRDGRSAQYKREMLQQLWSLLQAATGATDDQIVLGIQEVPASQAMEMGKVMPDVPPAPSGGFIRKMLRPHARRL